MVDSFPCAVTEYECCYVCISLGSQQSVGYQGEGREGAGGGED